MKIQSSIRPAILLGAAGLFAMLAAAPAGAAGHSGGGGHSGGSHGGSHGGSSHGGSLHGGSQGGSSHGGSGNHGGWSGFNHSHHSFRSHHGYGWGYYPFWGSVGWWWGWPYDPYYSGYYGARYRVRENGGNARFGRVKTDVEPDEAEVYLDGKYIGTADDFDGFPDYLYLEPGAYHLDFKLQNHQPYSVDLEIHRGETVKIDRRLASEPGHGRLDSFSPPSKGMPSGRVFGKGGEPVRPGRRARVEARAEERDADDDDDPAEAAEGHDREAPPREAMPPREPRSAPRPMARLRWNVKPEDAAIYLDDRYLGTGEEMSDSHRGTAADPGKHTVTVMRPGFKSKTVEVEVKSGAPTDVVVELEK